MEEGGLSFLWILCWFYPVILVLTKKTLCLCAEAVVVRGASEGTGKAEIAQGNPCQNLELLGSLTVLPRLLQNYLPKLCVFTFLGGSKWDRCSLWWSEGV